MRLTKKSEPSLYCLCVICLSSVGNESTCFCKIVIKKGKRAAIHVLQQSWPFFSHFHFLLHVLQKTIGSRFLSWGLCGTGTPSCVPENARVASVRAKVSFFPFPLSFQLSQREALATVGAEILKNVQGQGDELKRSLLAS